MNLIVHYYFRKCLPLVPVLSNPDQSSPCPSPAHFNIILPSVPRLSKCIFSSGFPTKPLHAPLGEDLWKLQSGLLVYVLNPGPPQFIFGLLITLPRYLIILYLFSFSSPSAFSFFSSSSSSLFFFSSSSPLSLSLFSLFILISASC